MKVGLLGLALVAAFGCEPGPNPAHVHTAAEPAWAVHFPRQPKPLEEAVWVRRERVCTIELEPLIDMGITREEIRKRLEQGQSIVAMALEGSTLISGPLPSKEFFSDEEIRADRHMHAVDARLLNATRLLRADMVRCFENRDGNAVSERFCAAVRIGQYVESQRDFGLAGSLILMPLVFDLAALVECGVVERMNDDAIENVAQALAGFVPPVAWRGTAAEEALFKVIVAFGADR